MGHLNKVCRSRKANSQGQQNHLGTEEERSPSPLFHLGSRGNHPIVVTMDVNGKRVDMELDTGAARTVMSSEQQQRLLPAAELQESSIVLRTYSSEQIQVLGELPVHVIYGNQSKHLPLLVVQGNGPCLLGRDWLSHIRLDWEQITHNALYWQTATMPKLQTVLQKHQEVFDVGLGTVKDVEVSLTTKPDAKPRFFRPRSVPFALKEAVGLETDRLEAAGILEKVEYSEWAAPIVPVPKKDGKLCICGDYKVTINPYLEVDQYPLPNPEEMFATLAGGKKFTKLDLSQAYQQLQLHEASKKLVTINTHKGLYGYTRLPFGVASAPALFQKTMDKVLQGMSGVMCYIDDILITGADDCQHLNTLGEVLERLHSYGFRLHRSKCVFMCTSVEYLGHKIDANGLQPLPEKIAAIMEAPSPNNATELRSFLGLLNYYVKFIPNLSSVISPLNRLLCKDQCWEWTKACKESFQQAKELLSSQRVLAHYNPKLPLYFAADASSYGIGAVISHKYPNGSEKPIAFASRTLTSTECNYAQLEKEALAIIYGVKKFHKYIYGRPFVLVTDHKPLTTIFHPSKGIPPLSAARLQHWALTLSALSYTIEFKRTPDHANADV